MTDMNENSETQQEYLGKIKPIHKEDLQYKTKYEISIDELVKQANDKISKYIAELEKENAELKEKNERLKSIKDVATLIYANNSIVVTLMQLNNNLVYANQLINKLKKCENCKENTTMNPYCIDCEYHSKWVLAD